MTALSIAEAERRTAADPQVSAVRRGGVRAGGGLASVTELAAVAGPRGAAGPENFRRAGVSRPAAPRPAGVSRRAASPAPAPAAGVSRDGRLARASREPVGESAQVGSSRLLVKSPSERARGEGPVRLTTRGRVVVVSLVVAAAAAVCTLLAAGGAAAASHGSARAGYRGMHQVVVEPGQTLWSIASAAEPTADPQAVIQQIMTANSLPGTVIHTGQVLWVPKG